MGGGGLGGLFTVPAAPAAAPTSQMGSAELINIIKQTVNATSDPMVAQWSDEGGPAVMQFLNGMLIISQTARGHERIAELLEQLRRERAIMISVEVRFLTVTDEFLQEISLNVDAAFFNRNEAAAGHRLRQRRAADTERRRGSRGNSSRDLPAGRRRRRRGRRVPNVAWCGCRSAVAAADRLQSDRVQRPGH